MSASSPSSQMAPAEVFVAGAAGTSSVSDLLHRGVPDHLSSPTDRSTGVASAHEPAADWALCLSSELCLSKGMNKVQMIFGVTWMRFWSAHQRCFTPYVRRRALGFALDSSQMSEGDTPILKPCV